MVRSILSFAPLIFVMSMKNAIHNTAAATSASLGGAQAAAHTALFATGMLCFMIGDVGSSLCQAFLPAFLRKADGPTRGGDRDSSAAPASPTFDLRAAWPTIVQLLRSTLVISASVVALATGVLTVGSGLVTHDPDVAAQILRIVPLIAVTLSLHGTAVSLEGLLMVKKDFATLCTTYAAVGASFIALQWLTRRMGWGSSEFGRHTYGCRLRGSPPLRCVAAFSRSESECMVWGHTRSKSTSRGRESPAGGRAAEPSDATGRGAACASARDRRCARERRGPGSALYRCENAFPVPGKKYGARGRRCDSARDDLVV